MKFLDVTFFQNDIRHWLLAVLIAALSFAVLQLALNLFRNSMTRLAEKTKTMIDDLIIHVLGKTRRFFIVLISLYIGSRFLTLSPRIDHVLRVVTILTLIVQAAVWGHTAIAFLVETFAQRRKDIDPATRTTISAMGFIGRLILWSLLLLLALDNMGFDVTALITGLGIGGIAVALAVQNILSDLFASLSIVLDKPFVIGDFIIVDNYMGVVEHIGLKTTRVRSISGEQLVFANSDLLNSRIRNYKRMYERRVVTSVGVTYETPIEKLEKIPDIIREILKNIETVRLDRVHFKSLGDFALIYEIVYYVLSPDYKVYIEAEQKLNLELVRRFRKEGIEFAYPTQTLFVQPLNSSPGNATGAGPT